MPGIGVEHTRRAVQIPHIALFGGLIHDDGGGYVRRGIGREPIVTRDGARIVDAKDRGSYVTSTGAGPSIGKHILLSYLPPEHAVVGVELAVEYLNERYPVTVAVAGSTPIFDPDNTRVKS